MSLLNKYTAETWINVKGGEMIIRDKDKNLVEIRCEVCQAIIGPAGGMIKRKPYCGTHYKLKAKPVKSKNPIKVYP